MTPCFWKGMSLKNSNLSSKSGYHKKGTIKVAPFQALVWA